MLGLAIIGLFGVCIGVVRIVNSESPILWVDDPVTEHVIHELRGTVDDWGNAPVAGFILSSSGCGPNLTAVHDAAVALTRDIEALTFVAVFVDSDRRSAQRFARHVDLSVPTVGLARDTEDSNPLTRFGDSSLERQIVVIDPASNRVRLRMDLLDFYPGTHIKL